MKISYSIYLFVLFFAPLAFGTSELWSLASVEVIIGIAATACCGLSWFCRNRTFLVPGLIPLSLLLAFIALQLVPLPVGLVRVIAPAVYDAYSPVISMTGEAWIPLSIHQQATLQELFRFAAYCFIYILTIQLLVDHQRLKRTLFAITWLGAGIALMAILQKVGSPKLIYWFRAVPDNALPFGPWINPNQYAGFMEMLSPIALGMFLFYRPRVNRDLSLRSKVVDFFALPGSSLYLFLGLASCLMAISVFVSLCRGGIITICLSLIVFVGFHKIKKQQNGRIAVFVLVSCLIVAVSWFGWDTVIAEFDRGVNRAGELHDGRFEIWSDSYMIIKSFLLTGSGFGTFIDIYPSFRTMPGEAIVDHAHNDYIEVLTDGGVIGFVLSGWFVFSVLSHGWKMIRARRDQFAVLIGIGCFTGIIALLMHSVTDFNMHNGAVGLYFFFMCGLLIATVNSRFTFTESSTLLPQQKLSLNGLYLSGVVIFTLLVAVVQYRVLKANYEYSSVQDMYISHLLEENKLHKVLDVVSNSERLNPFEEMYSYKLGTIAWMLKDKDQALRHFLTTVRKNPMDGASLQRIGILAEDESTSRLMLENGYTRGRNKDELALILAEYLLLRGDREGAIEVMKRRLVQTPALIKRWSPMLDQFSFTRDELSALLPDSVDAWILYGAFTEKMGNNDDAEYYRSNSLKFLQNAENIKPHWFQELISFYRRTGQPAQALMILRQGSEALPDYAPFHVQLGDYYRLEGIAFRAQQEYESALMLEPGNKGAKQGLRKMGLLDAY
jgi:O-antigen ligase/tetratricopeptide (TPR) repeat protein